jgi:hypothetical protein
MIKFNEYINLFIEVDAPPAGAGGAPPAGDAPPAGGAPAGGDLGGALGGMGGSSAPTPVPAASGGGGGAPSPMGGDLGGGGGNAAGLKTADINLKDAFYYLKKYFNKEKI